MNLKYIMKPDYPIVDYISIPSSPQIKYITDNHSTKKVAIMLIQVDDLKPLKLSLVNNFITEILSASEKYISPVVFINVVRNHINTHARIVFDNYDLFKLRVWCNQFREYEILNASTDIKSSSNSKEMMYLAYMICSKCVEYGKVR